MVLRYAILATTLFACCLAAGSRILVREPADPCEATPEIHACAVFLQQDWTIRRAQAGRTVPAPTIHASPAIAADAITVSDGAAILTEVSVAQEAGL